MSKGQFVCYVIVHIPSGNTYVGKTNHFARRLRQHNGEIAGGARSTRRREGRWKPLLYVHGFDTAQETLQFEWAMKHRRLGQRKRGVKGRIHQLERLLDLGRLKEDWSFVKLDVRCFLREATYLKLAAMDETELMRRHVNRGIYFEFSHDARGSP